MSKESIGFIDIYSRKLLNQVKYGVKREGINLVNEQETDNKMLEIIKSLCDEHYVSTDSNETIKFTMFPGSSEANSRRIFETLELYYTALYFNNLELLNKLVERDFDFSQPYCLNLYVLDSKITTRFDEDFYIEFVMHKSRVVKEFLHSLDGKEESLSDEECINIFVDMIKKNPEVTDAKCKNGTRTLDGLITKKNLITFGKEFIEKSSDRQKINILNNYSENLNEFLLNRLKNLMANHNVGFNPFGGWDNLLCNLTDEEVVYLDQNINYDLLYSCRCEGKFNNDGRYTDVDYEKLIKIIGLRGKQRRKKGRLFR